MDAIDNLLSRVSVGFENVLSKHDEESVLNNRIEESKSLNTPANNRDAVARKLQSVPWSGLTNQEQLLYLYG